MKSLTRIVAICVLGMLLVVSPAEAGRIGGAAAETGTLQPGESVWYDIPFTRGPAVVLVQGNGLSTIQLTIADGDGNVAEGLGTRQRLRALMNVYREGYLRVTVTNTGPLASTLTVSTN